MNLNHSRDIHLYGSENNRLRLCGKNETSSYAKFSYGVANRGSSIRIPRYFVDNLYGYIEDRRPGADMDPYIVTKTIASYAESNNLKNIDPDDQYVSTLINKLLKK